MPVFPNRVPDLQHIGSVIEIVIVPPQPVWVSLKEQAKPIPQKKVLALIDTGSTNSSITSAVAIELGLIVRDIIKVATPVGITKQPVYDVGIQLPNLTKNIFSVVVCEANLENQPYQALLGRDVLQECTLIYNGWDNSYQLHV